MDLLTVENPVRSSLTVSLAKSSLEVREAQQLRHRIFTEEYGAKLETGTPGVDEDDYDSLCDHLIVRDMNREMVVGTYRILTSWKAQELGRFYSETEFDMTNLKSLMPRLVEVGRSCIHADYRQGPVITLLWAGLARYMMSGGYEYLMGCASISLADGGSQASETYLSLRNTCLSPPHWRVTPHQRYPVDSCIQGRKPILPPLVKGYVRLGAYMCGEPGWDRQFNTADLFMLLPLSRMDRRYARHFFGTSSCQAHAPAA